MLTKRQNLLETIRGGNPDRFVNQYEAFGFVLSLPKSLKYPDPKRGELNVKVAWGVTKEWPENLPGAFPVHDAEHIVCPDLAEWKKYCHAPEAVYPPEDWIPAIKEAEAIDRNEQFVTCFIAPGVFEQCHYLLEIQNCMMGFYEEPEAMHELIDYITEWEVTYAKEICKYVKPDAVFHHDDWGTQKSTFMSPATFEEFFLPAYKKIYSTFKENGCELVVHHSDSYAATLVPYMIDMGIDIWQGVMVSNDVPKLIKEYGPQITFMGGIDSASIDHPGWTREEVEREVRRACTECGKLYFIPGASQGLPISTFEGVYEATSEEIDKMSREMFG